MPFWKKTAQESEPEGMRQPASAVQVPVADRDGGISGSTITYHDIHYSVMVKDPDKFCGKISKEILAGVR